jgi:ribosomal protein S18 acetylase RimI-like enzyme
MGVIEDLAELALATRLHRLADRLQHDVSTIYEERNVGVRARWFPLLQALSRSAPRSISDLARELGLTHTAINQIAAEMSRRHLLVSTSHPRDRRQRLLRLSPAGTRTVRALEPIWDEVLVATRELVRESGHDLLAAIIAVEARLDDTSMAERVRGRLAARAVEVVDYAPELARRFRDLNLAWLETLFTVEPEDRALLSNPEGQVIARGGAVLFATLDREAVGTCALIRRSDEVFELAKMAVAESHRGRGIGRLLAEAAIERARALGARTVVLLTSPKLEAAIGLYRSLGFREVAELPIEHPVYTRCSIAMRRDLDPPKRKRRKS